MQICFDSCEVHVERKISRSFTWLLCLKNCMEIEEVTYYRGEAISCGCELYYELID